MKIYIAMIADRHTDVEAKPFTDRDAAIAYARGQAIENAREGESDLEEEEIDGWEYYARYSGEGDSVWVDEQELVGGEAYDLALALARDIAERRS